MVHRNLFATVSEHTVVCPRLITDQHFVTLGDTLIFKKEKRILMDRDLQSVPLEAKRSVSSVVFRNKVPYMSGFPLEDQNFYRGALDFLTTSGFFPDKDICIPIYHDSKLFLLIQVWLLFRDRRLADKIDYDLKLSAYQWCVRRMKMVSQIFVRNFVDLAMRAEIIKPESDHWVFDPDFREILSDKYKKEFAHCNTQFHNMVIHVQGELPWYLTLERGVYIEKKRREAGLKRRNLAELLDVDHSYIYRLEQNYPYNVSPSFVDRFIEVLGVDPEEAYLMFQIPIGVRRSSFVSTIGVDYKSVENDIMLYPPLSFRESAARDSATLDRRILKMIKRMQDGSFGDWLSEQRERMGMSKAELANKTGISPMHMGRIEKGKNADIKMSLVIRLARSIGH